MIEIAPYDTSFEDDWESCVQESVNGTFLSTRRFLALGDEPATDCSFVIRRGQKILAVLPAGHHPNVPGVAVSHPKATYGGLVRRPGLRYADLRAGFELVLGALQSQGFSSLEYRQIPYIYCSSPSEEDEFAIRDLGGRLEYCQLNSVIDLAGIRHPSQRRIRALRRHPEIVVRSGSLESLDIFYAILVGNLAERHAARPTHSRDELFRLFRSFPNNVHLILALSQEVICAGVVVFMTSSCWHTQYIAANELGRDLGAIDHIFTSLINEAKAQQIRFVSFGTSNYPHGFALNKGLYEFKESFGGGGLVQRVFRIDMP